MAANRLTRRDFLQLSAAGAAVAALAACQPVGPQAGGSGAAAPGAATQEVTYWGHAFEPRVALDKVYIEQFMQEHPEISVTYENPGEYSNQWIAAIAAGAGPDLWADWNAYVGTVYAQGAIAPVEFTTFGMEEAEFMELYIEPQNTLQGAMFEGKLYGIPNELSIYCTHTNNALWEEAGLDPVADFPTTWEALVPVSEKLLKRDASGTLIQRGFDFRWDAAAIMFLCWGAMVRQRGGREFTEDLRTCTIDSPEAAAALQYWVDIVTSGRGGPQYQPEREAFQAGAIAMCSSYGSWARPGILEAGIEYTVHPTPRWENGANNNGFDIYAYFHMVNAKADPETQRVAWQLAWALDSHPVEYLEQTGLLQPQKIVEQSEAFQNTPNLQIFLDEMRVSMYSPSAPGFLEIADALARTRDRAAVEGMGVEESLAQGKAEIDEILDEAWASAGG
jgi:multiple sugar transport system substrate-binding protein